MRLKQIDWQEDFPVWTVDYHGRARGVTTSFNLPISLFVQRVVNLIKCDDYFYDFCKMQLYFYSLFRLLQNVYICYVHF